MRILKRDDVGSLPASAIVNGEWIDREGCALYLGQSAEKAAQVVAMKGFPSPGWARQDGCPLWRLAEVESWSARNIDLQAGDIETCLYRHFDRTGRLLYVGISLSAAQRTGVHRRYSTWFRQVASITLEWHPSRHVCEAAERQAIRLEKPLYNHLFAEQVSRKRK